MIQTQQTVRCTCTEHMVKGEDGPRRAYRFQALDSAGRQLCAVDDVCTSQADAHALVSLFERHQVSPVHVLDVLEDWVEARYGYGN